MSTQPLSVEIVLFDVGGHLYGTDASQVLRIDRPDAEAGFCAALGALKIGERALVFDRGRGEEQLKIDAIMGLRSVSVDSLRRMPSALSGDPCAVGVWLDGERPVLLLDLWKTSMLQGRQ